MERDLASPLLSPKSEEWASSGASAASVPYMPWCVCVLGGGGLLGRDRDGLHVMTMITYPLYNKA